MIVKIKRSEIKKITLKAESKQDAEMVRIMAIWARDRLAGLEVKDPMLKIPDGIPIMVDQFYSLLNKIIGDV